MKYNRQIYKQQLSNITLNGQTMNQRRYFTGVAGVKGQEGEIFGLDNLFRLSTESSLTNGIYLFVCFFRLVTPFCYY